MSLLRTTNASIVETNWLTDKVKAGARSVAKKAEKYAEKRYGKEKVAEWKDKARDAVKGGNLEKYMKEDKKEEKEEEVSFFKKVRF